MAHVTFDDFADLVRGRRTSMFVDHERPVPLDVVTDLCRLAVWAPNHKRTHPWRFAVFTGDGRARFGETMAADMERAGVGDEGKLAKTRVKYLRTPMTLVVAAAPHDNEMLDLENRDAVAAGVQNVLLAASTLGLASFWSTPGMTSPPATLGLCGFGSEDRIVGVIYLGWASQPAPATDRAEPSITHVDS